MDIERTEAGIHLPDVSINGRIGQEWTIGDNLKKERKLCVARNVPVLLN